MTINKIDKEYWKNMASLWCLVFTEKDAERVSQQAQEDMEGFISETRLYGSIWEEE